MARKRIALSQFAVSTEQYDGGVALTHAYRQCDWRAWVDGDTPLGILRTARAHGRVCDGKPQPRPARAQNLPGGGLIPTIWAQEIHAALAKRLTASI